MQYTNQVESFTSQDYHCMFEHTNWKSQANNGEYVGNRKEKHAAIYETCVNKTRRKKTQ